MNNYSVFGERAFVSARPPISSPDVVRMRFMKMKKFLEERTRLVRSLAEKADPFTKKRLLALADSYDSRIGGKPSEATRLLKEVDLSSRPT